MFKKLLASFFICPFIGTLLLLFKIFNIFQINWIWIVLPFVFQIGLMLVLLAIITFASKIIKRIL
jgi:hypothetical protein